MVKLNRTIVLTSITQTPNGHGGFTATLGNSITCYGNLRFISSGPIVVADKVKNILNYELIIRNDPNFIIERQMNITVDGISFNITSIENEYNVFYTKLLITTTT